MEASENQGVQFWGVPIVQFCNVLVSIFGVPLPWETTNIHPPTFLRNPEYAHRKRL